MTERSRESQIDGGRLHERSGRTKRIRRSEQRHPDNVRCAVPLPVTSRCAQSCPSNDALDKSGPCP